ncbi:unnamed protein product [Allacma fusca]|uniref:Uncharacterized protein n=1 Tax=Allacma fusca TaxID=39272 RepID=A0A8J2P6U1_9HEXA|nr:unnamed protein product [Allacma fusca]
MDLKFKKMLWLLGRKSKLSLENKLLLYKSIIRPIWTYGCQLWGTAKGSNIEIIQRFQNKTLRCIAEAPWFATNQSIHDHCNIEAVKPIITKISEKYKLRLEKHENINAVMLLDNSTTIRRLQRQHVLDL